MKVCIIGAGIGGLSAALALSARGFDCIVYEQAPAIHELGVGINLLPHAVKILSALELGPELERIAIATDDLIYADRFGGTVWHEPRGIAAGYDVPQYSIHRGRLQLMLLRALQTRFGAVVQTGRRFVAFEQDATSITSRFETIDGVTTETADILIGADGIHSTARPLIAGTSGPAAWNGVLIWRGATDWPAFLGGRTMVIAGGMREKLVIYPIAEGSDADRRLTNWSVNVKIAEAGTEIPQREDWSRPAKRSKLAARVARFVLPFIDVGTLVSATAEVWEYPMCDRDPLPFWSVGRATLLGDAAHPMYPVGSNGAGQAILDADALARALTVDRSDPASALRRYEDERLSATAAIVRQNRQGGPEQVIDLVEKLAPDGFDDIDDVLTHEERRGVVEGYADLAQFSRRHVNG